MNGDAKTFAVTDLLAKQDMIPYVDQTLAGGTDVLLEWYDHNGRCDGVKIGYAQGHFFIVFRVNTAKKQSILHNFTSI
jgi:hypothetical protein